MKGRRRRQRPTTPQDDVMQALRTGRQLEYSPERRDALIGTYYFHDVALSSDQERRAGQLLQAWRGPQHSHERAKRDDSA